MIKEQCTIQLSMGEAVKQGLTAEKKHLPSWLFYDAAGDTLFQQIMTLPQYYLTRCEAEILTQKSADMAEHMVQVSSSWDVVELGAGDGSKTKILLSALLKAGLEIRYHAIDISDNALTLLGETIDDHFPGLYVHTIHADFLKGLGKVVTDGRPKLVLFMGANIGNFDQQEAGIFLHAISAQLQQYDKLLIGFDLMKDPHVIGKAYNDDEGVTKKFNLNLLTRLNRELDSDFNIDQFDHWPVYDPLSGGCKSYLISRTNQTVTFRSLNLKVKFHAWEAIFTEISQKYDMQMIKDLAAASNLNLTRIYLDAKKYFAVALFDRCRN